MSRRIYDQGVLVQEWDDVTQTYRRWDGGVLVEERPYTTAEIDAMRNLGGITFSDNDVYMYDDDGSVLFRLGRQTHGDRGITIYRSNNVMALELRKPTAGDQQRISLYDRGENKIFSEAPFGFGLGRPFLTLPTQPVGGTATPGPFGWERTVSTSTFEDVFRWQGVRQNKFIRPVFNVRCSAADTAAEVRIVNAAGSVMTYFLSSAWVGAVAAGSTADQELKPAQGIEFTANFMSEQVARVQARRTAGTGSVAVSVKAFEAGEA